MMTPGRPVSVIFLMVTTWFAILFMTVHLADDVARNQFQSLTGWVALASVFLLVLLFFGTGMVWMQSRARAGYAISLFVSAWLSLIAVAHITGVGDIPIAQIQSTSGVFFVWVVLALAIAAISSLVLSVWGLVGRRR